MPTSTTSNKAFLKMANQAVIALPETGFIRLAQIVGNPKASPPIQPIIPISASSVWLMVKDGRFPKPVKLGPRTTGWRCEDVRQWIESKGAAA